MHTTFGMKEYVLRFHTFSHTHTIVSVIKDNIIFAYINNCIKLA